MATTARPGGVACRVVQSSDGEYEVHAIVVIGPYHLFVNGSFGTGWPAAAGGRITASGAHTDTVRTVCAASF
ncbi:MAG TPA: hypothetical protein VG674_13435 [Amycolatopsis sp.]|nr:hypothetical protein [Amycolatopsis sp.]